MKNNEDEEEFVLQDWLEFKTSTFATRENPRYVNIRSSEISEVIAPMKKSDKKWCDIVMKNGSQYEIFMPYEKVMQIL